MNPIPLTRRNHMLQVATAAQQIGLDPEKMLERAHVPMWLDGDVDDLIPIRDVLKVMQFAANETGDQTFGLFVGQANSFREFGVLGRIFARSVSVYDLLQRACQCISLQTSITRFWLLEAGDEVWFCRDRMKGMDIEIFQHEQYALFGMIRAVRAGAGSDWTPRRLLVTAPVVPRLEESELFANSQIHYDQPFTAIPIPRTLLSFPIQFEDLASISPSDEKMHAKHPAADFVGSLRQAIQALPGVEQPKINVAAEIAGLHARTLQRRLAEEGLTYRQLVDQARWLSASLLLRQSNFTVNEIADELGYEITSHFIRAFRRWSGTTPGQYRRQFH